MCRCRLTPSHKYFKWSSKLSVAEVLLQYSLTVWQSVVHSGHVDPQQQCFCCQHISCEKSVRADDSHCRRRGLRFRLVQRTFVWAWFHCWQSASIVEVLIAVCFIFHDFPLNLVIDCSVTLLLQSGMDMLISDFCLLSTPSNAIWKLTFSNIYQHPYHAAQLMTASASDSVALLNLCSL